MILIVHASTISGEAQPDSTVIYERRPGVFEPSRILTAHTLRDRPTWTEVQR